MHCSAALAAAAAIFGLVVSSKGASSTGTTASIGSLDWPGIIIKSISFSGNGCPQGTAKLVSGNEVDQSPWLYFNLDSFNVSIGPGTEVLDRTKNCQVHVSLLFAEDVAVAATAALTQGYARLDAGVRASWFSTYYFSQDATLTTTTETTLEGGGDWARPRPFRRLDAVPDASQVWSPCGANGILNANVRISLTSGLSNATAAISLADYSRGYNVGLRLDWKRCEGEMPQN